MPQRDRCHSRRYPILLALFGLLAWVALAAGPVEITFLHLNDTHGRLLPFADSYGNGVRQVGGAGYLAGLINQERERDPEGVVLLAAGDMFQGTAISNSFFGKPMLEFMNAVHFEGMAIGNHEFDWNRDTLRTLAQGASFPFLAANIRDVKGQPTPEFKPYVIIERKGVKIAVIGLATPETPDSTNPVFVKELLFLAPEKALPPVIKEVKAKGAQVIVVLSHLGAAEDKALAHKVGGIDLIIGGHSHTPIRVPVREKGAIITQAGCFGIYLGVVRLKVTPGRRPTVALLPDSGLREVLAREGAPRDQAIEKMVDVYFQKVQQEFAQVVGETEVALTHDWGGETLAGDVVCDAMREATGAEIAIQNSGGIRYGLPKGKLTKEQIFSLLPFDNRVVVVTMSGRQIRSLFERMAQPNHRGLQVSGLKVRYAREGNKRSLQGVVVGDKPLDDQASYKVATCDFLLLGGDGFPEFTKTGGPEVGDFLRDVMVAYLKRHSPIRPTLEGRISEE